MKNLIAQQEWCMSQLVFVLAAIALLAAGELGSVSINRPAYAATPKLVAMQMSASDSGVNITMPGMHISANDNGVNMDMKDNGAGAADPSKMPEFFLQMMNNMPMVYMNATSSATLKNGQQLSVNGQSMTVQINIGSHTNQIQIKPMGDHFELDESVSGSDVNAPAVLTTMGVSVNNQKHTMAVQTSNGLSPVTILPNQALSFAQSQNMIATATQASLVENTSSHRPAYQFDGTRNVRLFGLFGFPAKVQVQVDTTNGQAEVTSQPWYLDSFGWLFTS